MPIIGPNMGDMQNVLKLGGENKGSSQVSSDIWVNYVNKCRSSKLSFSTNVDKLKPTNIVLI